VLTAEGVRIAKADSAHSWRNGVMNRERVMTRLREHAAELKAGGIVRLWLFGSTARGDRQPESDIDLLAAFDENRRISLLDIAGLELQLAELLGQPVDLVEEGTLKPRIQKWVEAEAQRAFQESCPAFLKICWTTFR
jgi:uncharacterized protein